MTDAQRLAEARAAYHNLVTGSAMQEILDSNGERVRFFAADRTSLYQYILDLQAKCGGIGAPTISGPIGFIF